MSSCVDGRRGRAPLWLGAIGLSAALAVAVASPAEARRRAHKPAGGGYNPPFASMVVDAKTGRTLHGENEDAPRHPASVTKVMTLYLLFEQLERGQMSLETPLQVSHNAARQAPSKLGLRPGSTIQVQDAIGALVTKSANDVAVVVAENLAGSEEAFAERMTRKARALGMHRTVYRNASGLPNPQQTTTARDLTILARAIQERFPRHYRNFQARIFTFAGQAYRNHNKLLGRVEGVDGIKTGFTNKSGFNLMTSARNDDRHIVAVVLGGRSGGSRDQIMAGLVNTYLPRAYAGARTAPMIADNGDRPRPAVVAEVSEREVDVETTASTSGRAEAGAPLDLNAMRPASAGPTTTPSALRPSAPKLPAAVQAYAPQATEAPARPTQAAAQAEPRRAEPHQAAPRAQPQRDLARPTPWVIQLGAMDDEGKAKSMLAEARSRSGRALAHAAPFTERVSREGSTLYRARFSGFMEADDAQEACRSLKKSGFSCFATRS